MRALVEQAGQGAQVEVGLGKRTESAFESVGVVPVAMVLVETKEVFEFTDGLGKRLVEGGAVVAPDLFDAMADLLFHHEYMD